MNNDEVKLTQAQVELIKSIKKTQFAIKLANGEFLRFNDGNPFSKHYNILLKFNEWGDAEIFAQSMELKGYHIETVS